MSHTHKDEIIRLANSPTDTRVWYKNHDMDWEISDRVSWKALIKYIVNDEYAELRKAQADGKVIQESCDEYEGACQWCAIKDNNLTRDIKYYRVKPKTVKRWQWVYRIDRSKSNCGYSSDWNFTEKFMTKDEAHKKFHEGYNIIEWIKIGESAKEFNI